MVTAEKEEKGSEHTSGTPPGKLVVASSTNDRLQYELFVPSAVQSGKKTPVIVFLHGRGESGGFDVTNAQSLPLQLLTNASFTSSFPFIVLVPQCPWECAQENGWMDETLKSTTSILRKIIYNHNGDVSRVYLAGQSMGGNGAWLYASKQLHTFAAVVVVCGYVYPQDVPLVAKRLRRSKMGVGVVHAADDSVIPVSAGDEMVAALRAEGVVPRYWRYAHAPGPPMSEFSHLVGHGSYEIAFRDPGLYNWLLQHECRDCGTLEAAAFRAFN